MARTRFQRVSKNNRLYMKRARLFGGSDGTVKTETLLEVLDSKHCSYCLNLVEESQRTIDHVVPLIRDGIHSKYNLVMSCKKCNSNKGCLTGEEYIPIKDNPKELKRVINDMSRIIEAKVARVKALTSSENPS